MFDISTVNKRYYEIKIKGKEFRIEPCKVKTMKRLASISKQTDASDFDELISVVKEIIDKNQDKLQVGREVLEDLEFDEMKSFLILYMEWLVETKNSPNL